MILFVLAAILFVYVPETQPKVHDTGISSSLP